MPWLKRFRNKRPAKSKDGSAEEVRVSGEPLLIPVDLKGKKPIHDTIAVGGEPVCGLITSRERDSDLHSGCWPWYELSRSQPLPKRIK
jgi:hypothetical protein